MKYETILTVVIPVYNVDKFVCRAIKSVALQKNKNIEIIVIDDGSKDNSAMICDYICSLHDSIKVIHQINAGVAIARNLCMELANGKYIAFLDSDDWWDSGFINDVFFKELETYENDLLGFAYKTITSDVYYSTTFHVKERIEIYNGFGTGRFEYYPFWAFMYRNTFLKENNLKQFPVKINEDTSFTERCFCVASSVRWIDRSICNHWNNVSSVSTTMDWKTYFDEHYKSYIYMKDWHCKHGINYDVESRSAIIFSIILKQLCSYNDYSFVIKQFEEDARFNVVYNYQNLSIGNKIKTELEQWIKHPRFTWCKYRFCYRTKNDIMMFIYHHPKINHIVNSALFSSIIKHDKLSNCEKFYIKHLDCMKT